jgi:cobalt/nickel transport protein
MRTPAALVLLLLASTGQAHYHMLLPDKPSAKKGEPVTVTFQFGHPYEHQLSSMKPPLAVRLVAPDGEEFDMTKSKSVKKVALKGEKGNVDGYRLTFTPKQRGDYVLVCTSSPTLMKEDNELLVDNLKVVIHVQAQKGWDRNVGDRGYNVWEPLTRPYGLLPGTVFQARFVPSNKKTPKANLMVEVERYNPTPPKTLPADEFITRTMKTDDNGIVTTTLPEAGWWCLTTTWEVLPAKVDGKPVKYRQRSTLWVYIDKSAPTKPAE